MFRYQCCGLRISSQLEVPEFQAAVAEENDRRPDVQIRLGPVNRPAPSDMGFGGCVSITADEAHFYWEVAGHFLVSGGTSILIEPAPEAEADLFRLPLIGIVLAALLSQRGALVLHGSAVAVDGRGVGLIGEKGAGKSTTAGAFRHAGFTPLADDILALRYDEDSGQFAILPAFPQLKLWPEAARNVGADPDALPSLHQRVTKRSLIFDEPLPHAPVRLAGLYFLDWGDQTAVHALAPREVFAGLVPHTFGRRYGPDTPATAQFLLHSCSALAREVPVKRLVRARDLNRLPEVVEVVMHDLAGEGKLAVTKSPGEPVPERSSADN